MTPTNPAEKTFDQLRAAPLNPPTVAARIFAGEQRSLAAIEVAQEVHGASRVTFALRDGSRIILLIPDWQYRDSWRVEIPDQGRIGIHDFRLLLNRTVPQTGEPTMALIRGEKA